MGRNAPRVSVCLPSFNYAHFLDQCLESVWAQTFSDFELIVVDDASTDRSAEIIESCRDDRLHFKRHERRLGAVATWNHCLSLACGAFIAFICADDLFLPEKLRCQLELFERNSSIGLVHSDGYWMTETGKYEHLFSSVFPPDLKEYLAKDHITPAPLELRRLSGGYNYVHLSNAMLRSSCITDLRGFSPRFPYAADWDLWLRLARQSAVGYITHPLASYRRHKDSLTLHMQQTGQEFRDWYGVIDDVFKQWPAHAEGPDALKRRAYEVIREHLLIRMHSEYQSEKNQAVLRNLLVGFHRDPQLRTDTVALVTFLKSLLGGKTTKQRLNKWRMRRSTRDRGGS